MCAVNYLAQQFKSLKAEFTGSAMLGNQVWRSDTNHKQD